MHPLNQFCCGCTFDQLDVPLNYDLYDVLEK